MSTTTTLTTTTLVGSQSAMTNDTLVSENHCSMCGGAEVQNSPEAQRRIQELEGHVQELRDRAAVTGKQTKMPSVPKSNDRPRWSKKPRNLGTQTTWIETPSDLLIFQPGNSPTTKKKYTDCAPHNLPTIPREPARPSPRPRTQTSPCPRPIPPFPRTRPHRSRIKPTKAASQPSHPYSPIGAVVPRQPVPRPPRPVLPPLPRDPDLHTPAPSKPPRPTAKVPRNYKMP